jgi:hypothetical protein
LADFPKEFAMKKILLASVAVLALAGSTAVFAQHRPWMDHHHVRMNPEDRAAFLDARIAAVKAGLKLTPDQDKLWPAVESAVRDMVKLRTDRANARMEDRKKLDDAQGAQTPDNPVARLQKRADDMATTAAALKKIAEAADPLYKTLDDGQKRRLAVLTRMGGHFGGGEGGRHRGPRPGFDRPGFERGSLDGPGLNRPDFDRDGGPDRGPDRGFDHDDAPHGEPL